MPLEPGELTQWVELQAVTGRVRQGDGYADTWTTYAKVPAKVAPNVATQIEREVANTQQAPLTHTVTIRYRADVRTVHRVKYLDRRSGRDRLLYVRGVSDPEEEGEQLLLACEERTS